MTEKLSLDARLTFGDVDCRGRILLSRMFKLLQESAIAHANTFGVGTQVMSTRRESWVLNRIAVAIERYPEVDETLRVETWSNGIKVFKGFRDFRIYDARQQPIVSASSLWLYVSMETKAIVRVPRDVARDFPVCVEAPAYPELEKLPFDSPADDISVVPVGLRYSDFDANEHVNNAAYLDFMQTALARTGRSLHPRRIQVKYAKAIPTGCEQVDVRIDPPGATTRFSIGDAGTPFAVGAIEE
jgi:acyl-ACP thioesterase